MMGSVKDDFYVEDEPLEDVKLRGSLASQSS
jgi:hypothetical protein